MYSDGIFDKPEPEKHHLDRLPEEVFLMEGIGEISDFLASSKDLAIGLLLLPPTYPDAIHMWLISDCSLDLEAKSLATLLEQLHPLSIAMVSP